MSGLKQGRGYACLLAGFCDAVMAADERLAPYSRNYLGAHHSALQNTFPSIARALGENTFAALASVYTSRYPPMAWDLNLYGEQFPGLIQAQEKGGAATAFNWRLLGAIARVEYAITAAYYADDPRDDSPVANITSPHLLTSDCELREPWNSEEMQRQHPFANIDPQLTFSSPVAIWREQLRVQVSHTMPGIGLPPAPTVSPVAS
jgi:hypothetical protein